MENTVYLTKKELAKKLKCSITTIDNFRRKGLITGYGIGRTILFKEHEIEEAIVKL